MSDGSEFHRCDAATGKERRPTVESQKYMLKPSRAILYLLSRFPLLRFQRPHEDVIYVLEFVVIMIFNIWLIDLCLGKIDLNIRFNLIFAHCWSFINANTDQGFLSYLVML